jgi:hypothetical protein
MILLDTNVVSEMIRPTPERSVEQWFAAQTSADVYMCATTEAELRCSPLHREVSLVRRQDAPRLGCFGQPISANVNTDGLCGLSPSQGDPEHIARRSP